MEATLTDREILEAEKVVIEDNPFVLVEGEFLTIKTKSGDLVKFKPNTIQRKVLNKIKEIIAKNKPIRLWILKARQTGISTLIEALIYAFTSQRQATNSLVVADDIDGANYIFGMQKLYQEMLDNHLKPMPKHSNEKKLEFEGIHSQILIDTSENLNAGRKFTFRAVHLSEVAFFKDLRALMLGLNQSVPNLPRTMIIGETTANGIGNQFYDEWQKCQTGLSDWETLFIAWWEVREYQMPLEGGQLYPVEGIEFVTPAEREIFLIDEKKIKEKYGLTQEQLNWRRWCIVNNCNRSVLQFNQEYPDSPETAFISTGDLYFNKDGLKRQEIKKPLAIGNIVKEDSRYVFREDPTGLFRIYEHPVKDNQYVVAGDTAEGLEHGDKSSGVVLNKRTNKTACIYNHNVAPDRFEEDLIKMGHFYNDALIACESKGYGYSVNQGLYKNYGRVYRKVKTSKGYTESTLELGWNCVALDTLVLTSDFIWKKAGEVTTDDELIAFEENLPEKSNNGRWGYRHRTFNYQNVLKVEKFKANGFRIVLEDGRKIEVSNNHPFLAWSSDNGEFWKQADEIYKGIRLKTIPVWESLKTFDAGRLSGLLCGEGYITSTFSKSLNRYSGLRMHIAQTEGELSEEIIELWKKCGFNVTFKFIQRKNPTRPHKTMVYSGLNKASSVFVAIGQLQPKRLIRKLKEKNYLSAKTTSRLDKLKVIRVEEIGEIDVIGIETSGHTIITNGILSHNTNSVTRPQMLSQLAEEITNNSTDLLDRELIQQCWTFINNPKRGQPEAEKGKCDDLVMARAIAGQVRMEQPYKEKLDRKPKRKRFKGLAGY